MATANKNINKTRVCLLGAAFETGNLGVNALAESSVKIILNRWPGAEITFFGSGFTPGQNHINIGGMEITAQIIPVRFSKNIFLPYHFLWFMFYGLLKRILPGSLARSLLSSRNQYIRTLYESDIAVDITGGDSFSDIYGFKRFLLGTLRKWLVVLYGKTLVLMPQTYGPFKREFAKAMARGILNRAELIFSRDREGMEYVNALLGNHHIAKARFSPDVAFVLDPRRPENQEIESLEKFKRSNRILVGLNVSGLLTCCSGAEGNYFGLITDYPALINSIVEYLMADDDTAIVLIPHTIALHESDALSLKEKAKKGYREQSDAIACGEIYERFFGESDNRLFMVRGNYNHNEIKYIIGLCDFFIGARMHACIASLSQGIPAVGLAYSKKFHGVFESVGVEDMVIDMRRHKENEALAAVRDIFEKRKNISERLRKTIPEAQAKIINMFGSLELS
jgi:colanic acid/amylovoran biosynthesis protein